MAEKNEQQVAPNLNEWVFKPEQTVEVQGEFLKVALNIFNATAHKREQAAQVQGEFSRAAFNVLNSAVTAPEQTIKIQGEFLRATLNSLHLIAQNETRAEFSDFDDGTKSFNDVRSTGRKVTSEVGLACMELHYVLSRIMAGAITNGGATHITELSKEAEEPVFIQED